MILSWLLLTCWFEGSAAQSREADYLRQDSARFRAVYCPEDAGVVPDLWRALRGGIPQIERQLQLSLRDTVTFVITPSEREWHRVTAGAPVWANGIAYAERGVAILKSPRFGQPYGPLPVTALHEYVHLLLHSGAPHADIPRWLDEGLAQVLAEQLNYLDTHILARAAAAGRIHSLRRLESLMAMPAAEARQGYAESAVAVELIRKRYGMSGLSNLVYELRRGQPFEETFARVFSLSFGAFENEYAAHIRETYRFTLVADWELWFAAIIIVFGGAAAVAVWRKRKRTLQRWREEEGGVLRSEMTTTEAPYTINYTIVRNRLHGDQPGSEDDNLHDRPQPGN